MPWKCPECGASNNDSITKCTCGAMLSENDGVRADSKDAPIENTNSYSFITKPHPWIRYWARTFDLTLFSLVIGFFVFYSTGQFIGNAMAQVTISYIGLACFFGAFIVESILIAWIGTTPGKYLLDINVRTSDHSLLSFPLSLKRSLNVWVKGYAFGLPIISFFTVAYAGNNIQKYGKASWDVDDKIAVLHKPLNQSKKFLFIILFVGLLAVMAVLKQYGEAKPTKSSASSSPQVNSVTAVSTLQETGGATEADFDLPSLKRIEKFVVDASVKSSRETYAATGNDVSKFNPHVVSDSQFVNVQGKKLGIIKLSIYASKSDQKSTAKIVRVMGFTQKGVETVGCMRSGDEVIPVWSGVCGDKIREVFGVRVNL